MGDWMKAVRNPSVDQMLQEATGVSANEVPKEADDARSALVAEAIRIGLTQLFMEEQGPVHQLRLRSWVTRKVGSVVPEITKPLSSEIRDTIAGGAYGNLSAIGDIEVLDSGFLLPGVTRVIDLGEQNLILVGGTPTRHLGKLRTMVRLTGIGRLLAGVSISDLTAMGLETQTIASYLDYQKLGGTPKEILGALATAPGEPLPGAPELQVYKGRRPGQFGFHWEKPPAKGLGSGEQVQVGDQQLSLWREARWQSSWRYWLLSKREGMRLAHHIPTRMARIACIAFDALHHSPRAALIVPGAVPGSIGLVIDFPPFDLLLRWLLCVGGSSTREQGGTQTWEIPEVAKTKTVDLLREWGIPAKPGIKGERL